MRYILCAKCHSVCFSTPVFWSDHLFLVAYAIKFAIFLKTPQFYVFFFVKLQNIFTSNFSIVYVVQFCVVDLDLISDYPLSPVSTTRLVETRARQHGPC